MNSRLVHLWRAYTHSVTSIATTVVDVAPMAMPIPLEKGIGDMSEFGDTISEK